MADDITQERLKELLNYNPETGDFIWRVDRNGHVKAGMVAGNIHYKHGYREIRIGSKLYKAHRLVWLYVHGEMPVSFLDHINNDRSDNRLSNLRLATINQNAQNQKIRSNNTTGYKGVTFVKRVGRYWAQIFVNGKIKSLGYYHTPEEAHAAYCKGADKYFGEFARSA